MSGKEQLLADLTGQRMEVASSEGSGPRIAFAWARVSTEEQAERGLSMPEQLRQIREYAADHGIRILEEFCEAASAYQNQDKRVKFHEMVQKALSDPAVDTILVHDFSRFSRDSARAKALLNELRENGVEVRSLNDPVVDPESVAGVYLEAITLAKNEAYSREIAMHTRKGCRANMRMRDPDSGWCFKNGGQPLWGYMTKRVEVSGGTRGRSASKSIWVLDETMVQGRPVHEVVKYCLAELAANGATLAELRDYCNENGIPARRSRYWSSSTWNSLLQPNTLLKYCGYGVWNVHRKNGSKRPPAEWEVVENAHPAIISEEEAQRIAEARRKAKAGRFDKGRGGSRKTAYLLSGGLFVCGRCGANMTGLKTNSGRYYVCGSQPYRRGKGCGPGVYVPQGWIEDKVIRSSCALAEWLMNQPEAVQEFNRKLKELWKAERGGVRGAQHRLGEVESKIGNIHQAIEEGLSDAGWASKRLEELNSEREQLLADIEARREAPKVDGKAAGPLVERLYRDAEQGEMRTRKASIRKLVKKMELAPEARMVKTTYRLPEPVMEKLVAGAGFEPATFRL